VSNESIDNKKGLIIKSISGEYDCYLEDGTIVTCKPLGIFRLNKETPKVGDHVIVSHNSIVKIEKRKNDFIRPVVANITKNFIVTSVKEPDLNLNLLDRLISVSEYNDIETILIFTKNDLVVEEEEKKKLHQIYEYYQRIGYTVYLLPNQDQEKIVNEIKGNICVLSGQSGVGKSSLVNAIAALNIKTDEISKALGRGKHTTRHTELIHMKDGWIADTPGFGSIDLEMDETSLSQTFREFFETKCKYNGCLHLQEPGCKVREKVAQGEILKSRYENYLQFIKEIRDEVVEYNKKEKKPEVVQYYKKMNQKGKK